MNLPYGPLLLSFCRALHWLSPSPEENSDPGTDCVFPHQLGRHLTYPPTQRPPSSLEPLGQSEGAM